MTATPDLARRLQDPSLLRSDAFLGGRWCGEAESGRTFAVGNPSTGAQVATLPDCGVPEFRSAVDSAHAAQPAWAARSAKERSTVLRRWYDLMVANVDDLATILVEEQGKPFAEARGEVLYGASYVEWYAEEAKRVGGDVLPGHQADKRIVVLRQPVGVVAAITAWNFPNAMGLRKVAPALAVGCTIVLKPSDLTPLSSIALAVLAERAGVPPGAFSVITTADAPSFGEEVCRNPKVRKLTFTGSTAVGRRLIVQSAAQVMKVSMELGGNAPFIVFDDADLDAAVDGAILSKFRNAGQTCVCANRIYAQAGIHDAFVEKLAMRVRALRVGDGFSDGVEVGPLINEQAVTKVRRHIDDAVSAGARVVVGGDRLPAGGLFFAPTLLTGVTQHMLVAREETFGPLAPVIRFDTADDAIRMANQSEFGLAAYFYSKDLAQVWRVAEALESGMVGVNTGLISTEMAPFGGVKQSGMGREGSRYGIDDYVEMKYVCLGGLHAGA